MTPTLMAPIPGAAETKPLPENIRREFDLPSGKHVIFLRGKGRDLRKALMAAGPGADQFRILFSLIAQLSLIDGKRVTMESIEDMDFDDVLALQGEAGKCLVPLAKVQTVETEKEESPSLQ